METKLGAAEKRLEELGDIDLFSQPDEFAEAAKETNQQAQQTVEKPPASDEAETRNNTGTGTPGDQNTNTQQPPEPSKPPQNQPDELQELEKIETPQSEHWRRARELIKKQQAETARLKAELEQERQAKLTPPTNRAETQNPQKSQAEPSPAGQQISPVEVVSAYIHAKLGKFKERSKQIERDAMIVMEGYSPSEWLRIRHAAMNGEYGEIGDDVLEVVKEQLPIANAKVFDAQIADEQSKRQAQEVQTKLQQEQAKSYERATEKYQELKQENSEFRKYVEWFISENLVRVENGQIVDRGPLFSLLSQNNWPEIVADIAHASFRQGARIAPTNGAGATNNGRQTIQRPVAEPSGKASASATSGSRLAQLEAQLASMGKIKLV